MNPFGFAGARAAWPTERGLSIVEGLVASLREACLVLPSPDTIERAGLAGRVRASASQPDSTFAIRLPLSLFSAQSALHPLLCLLRTRSCGPHRPPPALRVIGRAAARDSGGDRQERAFQALRPVGRLRQQRPGDGAERDEQRKMVKYNHLVANLLIFHTAVGMTRALEEIAANEHELRSRPRPGRHQSLPKRAP